MQVIMARHQLHTDTQLQISICAEKEKKVRILNILSCIMYSS